MIDKTTDVGTMTDLVAQLADCDDRALSKPGPQDAPIPKRSSIGETIELYRTLLFPMIASEPGKAGDVDWQRQQACQLRDLLTIEFQWALSRIEDARLVRRTPEEIADLIMSRLPAIKQMLVDDARAAYAADPACTGISEVLLCYPGFLAISVHRLAHEIYRLGVRLLARMMAEWVHGETGIDIHPGARIGRHFFIDHGTGVVIGETCVVGDHVRLYQGVTLGALSFARDESGNVLRDTKRHPTVEDHVIIYANATVLGGKTVVGHHSIIGASVWLAQSVAPYTTVVMEQPKLRFRNQSPTAFDQPPDYQI